MLNEVRSHGLRVLFGWVCFSSVASGALVSYRATGEFRSSTFPSDIAIGDQFTISFTLDDEVRDTDVREIYGEYPGALRFFEFRLTTGHAAGQYAGGSAELKGVINTAEYSGDRFYLRVDGGTFPPLAGNAFESLLFVLDDPTQTSSISDSGGNPSLREVLHGPLNISQFDQTTLRIMSVNKTGSAEGVVTSLVIVPEPTTAMLLAGGFAFLGQRRRSRFLYAGNARS